MLDDLEEDPVFERDGDEVIEDETALDGAALIEGSAASDNELLKLAVDESVPVIDAVAEAVGVDENEEVEVCVPVAGSGRVDSDCADPPVMVGAIW